MMAVRLKHFLMFVLFCCLMFFPALPVKILIAKEMMKPVTTDYNVKYRIDFH